MCKKCQIEGPYEARSIGSDGKPYVQGPGNGCDYHSGTLFPEYRCRTVEDAEVAARIANTAYRQGYIKAQSDIRKSLGV